MGKLEDLFAVLVGGAEVAQNKISQIIEKMIAQGEISKKQGEKIIKDTASGLKRQKEILSGKGRDKLILFLKNLGVAFTEDVRKMEERVEKLEKK